MLTNVALTGEPGSVIDGQGQEGFSKMRGAQKPDQNALREGFSLAERPFSFSPFAPFYATFARFYSISPSVFRRGRQ